MAPAALPVTVYWVAQPAPPSAAAQRSLTEWAEARGVRLATAQASPRAVVPPDLGVADVVEDELLRARDAITSEDAPLADAALTKAEGLLHAHPDLPEASWLLAEVLRARAARWRLVAPHDSKKSGETWRRAATLDGGRVPGFGEAAGEAPLHKDREVTARSTISLVGLPADEAARVHVALDGVPATTQLAGSPGEHQVRLTLDGSLLWAEWVELRTDEAARVTPVMFARAAPCSREDLSRSGLSGGMTGVACEDWVRVEALAADDGELAIARCNGAACGPSVRWKVGAPGPIVPDWHANGPHWPAWATVAIVTASVVVVAGATLAATGAFRPKQDAPLFTTGGLHISSTPVIRRYDSVPARSP